MNTSPRVLSACLITAVVALSGCYASPEAASEAGQGDVVYWTFQDIPDDSEVPVTVAITEFAVEFVTKKALMPGPRAAAFDPTQYAPYVSALHTLGLSKRRVVFEDELLTSLPAELYDVFVDHLGARDGLTFTAPERVRATKAYQLFETAQADDSTILRYLNPVGSDTGRIRAIEFRGHPQLPLIVGLASESEDGEDLEAEDVEAQIATELGVDVAMRVRLRVSVHKGLASIERDSTVSVIGKGLLGMVVSNRSLTSDEAVTKDESVLPVLGVTYEVDSEAYRKEIKRLLRLYLDLGQRK